MSLARAASSFSSVDEADKSRPWSLNSTFAILPRVFALTFKNLCAPQAAIACGAKPSGGTRENAGRASLRS
jgi:hypothetical protein